MRVSSPLLLIVPALALMGCATQQTLDAQADAASRQFDAMKQAQAGLADTQKNLEARLAKLESEQALLASSLQQGAPASAAMRRELDGLKAQADAAQSRFAALAGQVDAQGATAQSALAALGTRIDAQAGAIAQAQTTADDAVKIARDSRLVSGKVIDSLVLTEGMVMYGYEYPELMPEGRAALDKLIAGARPQLPHVFIEIVGFSDDVSLGSQNRRIALERAEAVRRYLHEVGTIPLHRMSAISYGDLKPLSTEPTYEARRQNRRVIVQVLK
jgi:outer membrane protein OmpA-like peptidoglycan-associated protein